MASWKREMPISDAPPEAKKAKVTSSASQPSYNVNQRVVLNPADCDLDFNIEANGLQGWALYEQGFAYFWSGARATIGISRGKYCFGCKIISAQPVDMEDTPVDQQHVCRVGISRGDDAVGSLGETLHSFGYGGTGKFSNAGKFLDYGEQYGVGDTIICCVDLESKPMASIGFSKNGKWLGVAKTFHAGPGGSSVVDSSTKSLRWGSAFFPHILLKNVVVHLQFSVEDGLVPEQGYKPWDSAPEDRNAILGPTFLNLNDCELMMMVGLPASGKTTWAEKWVKDHPEKRYMLLGTNLALDQMKVPGLLRKHNYGERFERLMDRATGIFNTLLSRASRLPRNFIIDQTNVYKSARKRKLKPFASYWKIAVVIFPKPDELKIRADKRFKEMGKEVPAEAVNEMLANFVLPMSKDMHGTDEYFDEVWFPELSRTESQKYLEEMKASLKLKVLSPYSRESSAQASSGSSMQHPRETSNRPFSSPSVHSGGSLPGFSAHWTPSYSPQMPLGAPEASSFSYHLRDDFNHYGDYSGISNAMGSTVGMSTGYYQGFGAGTHPQSHSGVEDRKFFFNSTTGTYGLSTSESYQRPPPFVYHTPEAYASRPGVVPPHLSAQREPAFQSNIPMPHDSYATPTRGPPYGNFPTHRQPPQKYGPPRPGYY